LLAAEAQAKRCCGNGNEPFPPGRSWRRLERMNTGTEPETYEVAIVGGGAAGLSAALVLGRARRDVIVIDAGRPRNAPAAHMQGFLSRDGTPPSELLDLARAEVLHYGVELVTDRVVDALEGFTLRLLSGRVVAARHVLLATGAGDVLPVGIEGAWGRWGRDFLHCPYCHGWEVRDRPVGVLASAEHAHLLRQWTDDVILFTHTAAVTGAERATLEARGIAVVDGIVERLVVEDDRLQALQLDGGRTVAREALFIRPELRANLDNPAVLLGCELRDDGLVHTGPDGRTSVPGVWAAGNATNPRAQVITAAGEGSAAAIAINTELVRADVDAAGRALHAAA
jgi:thioredoxin reductase